MSITYTLKGDLRSARTGDKTRIIHPFSIAKPTDPQACFDQSVANAAVDDVVSFGSVVNATLVALYSNQELSVKINGTGNFAVPFKEAFILAATAGQAITSLHLSNASGQIATVQVYIVGAVT